MRFTFRGGDNRGRIAILFTSMVRIKLEKLSKRFDETEAVDNVSLTIESGELFFLLGPSGCGKSTLLRMIAGLIEPTAGRVLFGERDVTTLPTGKRNTAMVFQGYALWPHMTVAQNVAFGLDVRQVSSREKKSRVVQALEQVRLTELAGRKPAQLSGGQQQRVALARALVVNPDVLLLDEPLSNLDAKLRLEMRQEIRRICSETGITTVYVTHDQEEALSMADRIAVMNDGVLCQVGPPEDLYNRPASKFVASFLGQTNFISASIEGESNGKLRLRGPFGPLHSRSFPKSLPSSSGVTCSIRPEACRILREGEKGENILAGKHLQTVYLGHAAQHILLLEDGAELLVAEHKPRAHHWNNNQVRIGFGAEDVVVLIR